MWDELKMLNVLVRVLRDTFVAWNAAPTRTPVRTVSSCTNACKKQCKTISLRQLAVFWLWNQFRRKIIHDYRRFRARIREGRAEMSEHDGTIGSLGIRRGESQRFTCACVNSTRLFRRCARGNCIGFESGTAHAPSPGIPAWPMLLPAAVLPIKRDTVTIQIYQFRILHHISHLHCILMISVGDFSATSTNCICAES